jgi:plasmid maintenance system antidote protein VapI
MKEEKNVSLTILNETFSEKKKRNPNYSLRAFARDLEISASNLSTILNGKKRLSSEQACRIAVRLQFSKEQFFEFVTSTLLN